MIINELFYYGVNQYFDQLAHELREERDIEKRLRLFIKNAIHFSEEDRDFLDTYVQYFEKITEMPAVKKKLAVFHDLYIEKLMDIINEGVANGAFQELDAARLAHAFYLWSAGALFSSLLMNVDFDIDAQLDVMLRAMTASSTSH